MDKGKRSAIRILILYVVFIVFTVTVRFVDVQAIGPSGSSVGLASVNGPFHELTGENGFWYDLTEATGLLALAVCGFFALMGLVQAVKRRSIRAVDRDLLILGVFYAVVLLCYVVFEFLVINYRPVITDEGLEASYPSSHTVLIVCVMLSLISEINIRIKHSMLRRILTVVSIAIALLTVFGRLVCGVHWLTDIIGGVLLSIALLYNYYSFITVDVL